MTTTNNLVWAFAAEGIDPGSKLVLLLVANGADQDGRLFAPYDRLAQLANMTLPAIDEAVEVLRKADLAVFSVAEHHTGERRPCITLLTEGV